MNIPKTLRTFPALLVLILACPLQAGAQTAAKTAPAGVFPAQAANAPEFDLTPAEETHPMLRLTPDKPQIVHLTAPAHSVIVGNPAHLNAIMDSAKTLVLVPRDPGATYFTVIGQDGKVLMERYVIVAGPADKYIRIRRSCAAAGSGTCVQTSVYYCPDMCYETGIMGSAQGQPSATSNNSSGSGGLLAGPDAGNAEAAPEPAVSPDTGRPVDDNTQPAPVPAPDTNTNTNTDTNNGADNTNTTADTPH
jgi:hypothetical protein